MSLEFRIHQLIFEGNEYARWGQSRGGWGVAHIVESGELANFARVGFTNVPAPQIGRVPRVQNVSLYANPVGSGLSYAGILRWEIQAGVGTASTKIIVDAQRFQQVSLSAESMSISLFLDAKLGVQDPGNLVVSAGAYQSDGNTSTSASTYTVVIHVPTTVVEVFQIPEGASTWQIFGASASVNVASVTYLVKDAGGSVLDSYTGDQLLNAHTAGAFIPLPGGSQTITVDNTANVNNVDGTLLFQLDL